MIQPNNYEKALVPYIPIEKKKSFAELFDLAFTVRKSFYLWFLGLFFLSSAFARCVSLYNPEIAMLLHSEVDAFTADSGFSFFMRCFLPQALVVIISYFSGYTPFAFVITAFSAVSGFYRISFLYFSLISDLSFKLYSGIAVLLSFTLLAVSGVVFYSEVLLVRDKKDFLHRAVYSVLCVLYLGVIFFALRHIIVISN